jgi:hypothetical protein
MPVLRRVTFRDSNSTTAPDCRESGSDGPDDGPRRVRVTAASASDAGGSGPGRTWYDQCDAVTPVAAFQRVRRCPALDWTRNDRPAGE